MSYTFKTEYRRGIWDPNLGSSGNVVENLERHRGTTLKYVQNGNSRVFGHNRAYSVRALSHDRSLQLLPPGIFQTTAGIITGTNHQRQAHTWHNHREQMHPHVLKLEYCQLLTRLDRAMITAHTHVRIIIIIVISSSCSFGSPCRVRSRTHTYTSMCNQHNGEIIPSQIANLHHDLRAYNSAGGTTHVRTPVCA